MLARYFIADDVLSISGKLPPFRGRLFFLPHTILWWLPFCSSTSQTSAFIFHSIFRREILMCAVSSRCWKFEQRQLCVFLKHWLQTRLKPTCCIGPCYFFKQLISCKFSISVGTAFLLLLLVTSTFCKKETQYCKHWCHHLYMKHQTGFLVKLDSAVFCFVLLYYRIW